jgi:hypothetical protein
MNTPIPLDRYKNHRFPAEIITYGVWLHYRFCLSYRDVKELLFARGIMVSYEAIRKWCGKFGQQYARMIDYRYSRYRLIPRARNCDFSRSLLIAVVGRFRYAKAFRYSARRDMPEGDAPAGCGAGVTRSGPWSVFDCTPAPSQKLSRFRSSSDPVVE